MSTTSPIDGSSAWIGSCVVHLRYVRASAQKYSISYVPRKYRFLMIRNLDRVFNRLERAVPRRVQVRLAAEVVRDALRERAFPPTGPGRQPDGTPYPGYKRYVAYISVKAKPKPPGTPTKGGRGRTVRFEDGWGGGPESYRAKLGLPYGRDKNLVLTGKTARALIARTLSSRRAVLTFRSSRMKLAAALNQRYGFWGLGERERRIWRDMIAKAIEENLLLIR